MHSNNHESNSLRHGEQRWTFVAEAEASSSSSSSSTSNSNDHQSFECELMSENDTATAITDNEKEKNSEDASSNVISPHGLQNLGNTCYFNAALQMLFSLPSFASQLKNASDYYQELTIEKERPYKVHIIEPLQIIQQQHQQQDESSAFSSSLPSEDDEEAVRPITNKEKKMPLLDALTELSSSFLKENNNTNHVNINKDTFTAINPQNLKDQVDSVTDLFRGYRQQDAHEFLITLLDLLQDEMIKASNANINRKAASGDKEDSTNADSTAILVNADIQSIEAEVTVDSNKSVDDHTMEDEDKDYVYVSSASKIEENSSADSEENKKQHVTDQFQMEITVKFTCESCDYTRSHVELYNHLSFEVPANNNIIFTVEDALAIFFGSETLSLTCEHCGSSSAIQKSEIQNPPRALLIHLKRFTVEGTWENLKIQKNCSPVEFQKYLSLSPFMAARCPSTKPTYRLKSIVHHIGSSADCGHYVTDALYPQKREQPRRRSKLFQWYRFNDSLVIPTSWREVESSNKSAYMLLYELLDSSNHDDYLLSTKTKWKYFTPRWWVSKRALIS